MGYADDFYKQQAREYEAATGGTVRGRRKQAQRPMKKGSSEGRDTFAGSPELCDAVPVKGAHPTVSSTPRGQVDTPINNMGVTDALAFPEMVDIVQTATGKIQQILVRVPAQSECAVIDWISFTVKEDTWSRTARETLISDEQYVTEASRHLEKIFGFGVTKHLEKGRNFYRDSWMIGDEMGFVCFGGQKNTMQVCLTGQGCAHAVPGWEKRLYAFLSDVAIRPVITRIDLAYDDFFGRKISVEWAEQQWLKGGFTANTGGIPPEINCLGNWHRPNGKGRTVTFGLRSSGKFCRFYEKGKKEGDKESMWCRCEVEFKNSDRLIPFDILLSPSDYFVAAYPCFPDFATYATPKRTEVLRNAAHIAVDRCCEIVKRQFGKHINLLDSLLGTEEMLRRVRADDLEAMPKRMQHLGASATTGDIPIHRQQDVTVPKWIDFISSLPSFGLNGDNGFSRASN